MNRKWIGLGLAALGAVGAVAAAIALAPARQDVRGLAAHEQIAMAERQGPRKGPDAERWYFETWHQQYGAELPREVVEETWNEIQALPSEPIGTRAVNAWESIGPAGIAVTSNPGTIYSGRILDLDVSNGAIFAGSASGGLWAEGFDVVPLTDELTSLAIGAFAIAPGSSANTIVVGTGEPWVRAGTGFWRTTDRGDTWTQPSASPYQPSSFYRILYDNSNPNIVHAAAGEGYYRSTDGGLSWEMRVSGLCTDMAVYYDVFFTTWWLYIYGDGLYWSWDDGETWTKEVGTGIPSSNLGDGALGMGPGGVLYVSIARADNYATLGVYRLVNGTFLNVTPPADIHKGQGWYDNVISVQPNNQFVVLVGGVEVWRTVNGGASWSRVDDPDLHPDHHVMVWSDNNTVWCGNDGGLSVSSDAGATWVTNANVFPITQYVNFDVQRYGGGEVIFGGSQDNGFSGSIDSGSNWYFTFGGDGGGFSIDPNDGSRIWATGGVYGGDWAFRRHRSFDSGWNWDNNINAGIPPSGQWYTKIRNDQIFPVYLYTNSGTQVFRSINYGDSWTAVNPAPFPTAVYNMSVGTYDNGSSVIYACLDGGNASGQLRVYDNGSWAERANGLPASTVVRGVSPHPNDTQRAHLVMTGFIAGQKVFETTNRGVTWTNVSGNLPNVPMGDVAVDPNNPNVIWVATEFGCYRTVNHGASWERWNNGMPGATIVTELALRFDAQDLRWYLYAATYGRAIWRRDVTGDDPSDVADGAVPIDRLISEVRLGPNPLRGAGTLSFTLGRGAEVRAAVYDVSGREVMSLLDGEQSAGPHSIRFESGDLPAGTYWYRMSGAGIDEEGRFVVAR